MTQSQTLLSVTDLRLAFGAHEVVKGVSFHINAGEKLALVGESGSGKTLTALSLLGLVANARTSGRAVLEGQDLLGMTEHQLRGVRGGDVAMVFQEPMTALNPLMTVGKQIAEIFQLKQGLPLDMSIKSAIDLLASTGLPEPASKAQAYPHQLSGGQRQRAMIAMALASAPKLLLADEPTTALDVSLRGQILDLLATQQRERGMAVLLITHDLQLVRRFANRVAIMERGVLVEQGTVAEVFANPQHPYTQKLLNSRPQRDPLSPIDSLAAPPAGTASPLQAANLGVSYPVPKPGIRGWFGCGQSVALKAASFALQPGQTLGVVGESGSGKSTLALAALDLIAFTGDLRVAGQPWSRNAQANRRQRSQVQVVFQDPFSSLSPRMTVEQIVGEGLDVHAQGLPSAQRRERVLATLASVGLVDEGADHAQAAHALLQRYPHEFSGGQRQRLAIARALIVEPAVLVLDEPTSALDVTVQQQVLTLLQRLQRERQLSYLLITHDMDVIQAMAHQVLVLKGGEVVEQGGMASVFSAPRHAYTQALLAAAGY
ncbi:MAG: dipeptide ABC transporter ATP-binding protein [Burkholderiaceae bacterium]